MPSRYREIDLQGARFRPLEERSSKVTLDDFGCVPEPRPEWQEWLEGLPDLLAARDLKRLVSSLQGSKREGRGSVWMLGGHVVKCGLTPYLVRLMDAGFITCLAVNGSVVIHDLELALVGHTSETVEETLPSGSFGMWAETAESSMAAMEKGHADRLGLGESFGAHLVEIRAPHLEASLVASAYEREIPVTVHVGIGTDTVHQHPAFRGDFLGELSLRDFRILAARILDLHGGGTVLNIGSAVLLPEVFVKALNLARNLGHPVEEFVTANLDMLQHYRPRVNVLARPVGGEDRGIALTGHHEILLPLLTALLGA